MRKLIYIPIIHSGADMGSIATKLIQKGIDEFGKEFWEMHVDTVNKYWEIIGQYCDTIDFGDKTMKIYQDGMVADGEVAMRIIEDNIKVGSKNYDIISRLIKRGAFIVQTEDISMVKKEVEMLKSIPYCGTLIMKLIRIFWLRIKRANLLKQRDKYIAGRIDATLGKNETGIIFLGAYHQIINKLPKDIIVNELKEVQKVRAYQKLLPFHDSSKIQFKELSQYLINPVVAEHM
jgi:hypothetical protein